MNKHQESFNGLKMKKLSFVFTVLCSLSFIAHSYSAVSDGGIAIPSDRINSVLPDSLSKDSTESIAFKDETEIVIKNKDDYSKQFVDELRALGYEKIELIDSLIIFNGKDTAYFPELPIIGKHFVLTGRKGDLAIALSIQRINYSTIGYNLEMVEFGRASHNQTGQADISANFFLGAESDESDISGLTYFATEFLEFKDGDCYTYIRLGYDEESGPFLLGKIKKNCNGEIMDIDLNNFTTLIEK